jgi:hypothetical protein
MACLAHGQCVSNSEDKVIRDASVHDEMLARERSAELLNAPAAR